HRQRASEGLLVERPVLAPFEHPRGHDHLCPGLEVHPADRAEGRPFQTIVEGVVRRGGPAATQPVQGDRGTGDPPLGPDRPAPARPPAPTLTGAPASRCTRQTAPRAVRSRRLLRGSSGGAGQPRRSQSRSIAAPGTPRSARTSPIASITVVFPTRSGRSWPS